MKFLLPMYRAVYWRIYAKSLRNASAVVTNSATVQRRLKRYFQVDSDVLYPSIDIQEFTNLGYHKYFLHVSRLQREKRQEYAIASFERFLTERKDFSLVIAGTWGYNLEDSRSYLKQLQRHVEEKQLPVRFVVNPARKELLDLYANAYACLFTAEEEDLGLVPLEAMASGKPVISVNEGGPTETIIDGVNGFLVNSTGQMAEKMFYLVENPSIVRQMGDEGQRHVRAKFSDQIFRERLDKIIARMKKQNV
jgi:glycosyltransferase involved in cell wall biosynthesis